MAPVQLRLDGTTPAQQVELDLERLKVKRDVLTALEGFLSRHTSAEDLGLKVRGEQLAAGVRFVRMVREGRYDLVVANPPYQGTSKMADTRYIERTYPLGKADLFAAFLLRGLELAKEGGVSAMLTMRNWMFIKQYAELRKHVLKTFDMRSLGDFAVGAFDEVPNDVLSVVVSVIHHASPRTAVSVALQPTPVGDTSYDRERTKRKRAATLTHEGRHTFDPAALKVVPEWPLVYWWDERMLRAYRSAPLIGTVAPAVKGLCTGDDTRLTARPWEQSTNPACWQPTIKGGKGRAWIEPLNDIIRWGTGGLIFGVMEEAGRGTRFQGRDFYFRIGIAFSMIGANFSARVHRYPSIFGNKGSSVFPDDLAAAVCAMNSTRARDILASLNPGIGFEVGDVNRLPLFPIANADTIFAQVESAFTTHESHREPSVEFRGPGASPWRHAQDW
ncbi:MAG TPA: Eco57I restriction-modification methylase domain-containing protein, partial [Myxococcota bacterium]|nr:Eco57I restriction-modification methylase domain-containing protein [Myxococcota bacterium]